MTRKTTEDIESKRREFEKFHAERQRGIGASDAPALLGLSPWKTALDVYADKVGISLPAKDEENEAMEWGHILEPFIAKKYCRETKRKIIAGRRFRVRSSHPFMNCHLDRLVHNPAREGHGVLEIKNISGWKEKDWSEEPPLQYQVQLMHQMAVTGLKWGSLAALIGGQKFVWFDLERNENFVETLTGIESDFWNLNVLAKKMPAVTAMDIDTLRRFYPVANGKCVDLPAESLAWDSQLQQIKQDVALLKEKEEHFKALLIQHIGENSMGNIPQSGIAYKYGEVKRAGYVVEETNYRQLKRVKYAK